MSALTFYFKEIFPDYAAFTKFINDYQVSGLQGIPILFNEIFYKWLFREYCHSNVQYDTPEEFKLDFATVYEQHMQQFSKQLEMLNNIYKLTSEELLANGERIIDMATNPNTTPGRPFQKLEYVTDQTAEQITNAPFEAWLSALSRLPSLRIRDFVAKFKHLFKTSFYTELEYYEKGE